MSLNTWEHAMPMLFNEDEIPQNCPKRGGCGPPSNTWLLGPTARHTPNAISLEPAESSGLTVHYPYTLLWDGPFPTPKLPFPWGGIRTPHLIHGDCRPPHPTCQTASRSVQPFLQGTSTFHHRPTDHGNISSNRPHRICYAYTMRPNNTEK